jgi:hypothetical protein
MNAYLGVLGVIFCAILIRSAFDFGEALIAVPTFALFMTVEVAAPSQENGPFSQGRC